MRKKNKTVPARERRRGQRDARPTVNTDVLTGLLGFRMRLAMTELRRSYLRNVGDGGVRPGLASLLQLIAMNRSASQAELADALHLDKATLVALIDKAESAGWLSRQRAQEDRRRHELVLTQKGVEKVRNLSRQTDQFDKKFRARFTSKELTQLMDYLERIYSR
jgi:DNA-binding MarR family transcriptional regulator